MKAAEECVECASKRAEKLVDGRVSGRRLSRIVGLVRSSVRENVGKKSSVILAKGRNRAIARALKVADVSREKKDLGIAAAKKIAGSIELPEGGFKRFRQLVRVVIAANSMELDLPGHSTGLQGLEKKFEQDLREQLGLDESREIYGRILSSKNVLYLCDNAPELVFDVLMIGFLRSLGKKVTPVVRGRFTQDDATPREARMVGLNDFITTGSATPGVVYWDVTKKLRKLLRTSDFIIAKGMGNFEGLTETPELIRCRVAFLFKAKCVPVAREIGVPKGSGVAFRYGCGLNPPRVRFLREGDIGLLR